MVRFVVELLATVPILAVRQSGHLGAMSIFHEHSNKADQFDAAIIRHFVMAMAALVRTVPVGVPLGVMHSDRPVRMPQVNDPEDDQPAGRPQFSA